MANEFDLIARYFSRPPPVGYLGVGDDCALLPMAAGMHLAASTDLLVEGRHFVSDVDPRALGHKALAVNLSDLAAMGAQPLGCLLGLSLPRADPVWLDAFSSGLHALADAAACPLVGGDTTRSPAGIVISVTVFGQVDRARALRRDAAQAHDDIWVTGFLGAADIALKLRQGALPPDAGLLAATQPALDWPDPPVRFAQSLGGVAHAALDISDGLAQDLGHILAASHCGAQIDYDALPLDPALDGLPDSLRRSAALGGGDVYQLCFTASGSKRGRVRALGREHGVRLSRIGRITEEAGLGVRLPGGQYLTPLPAGFDHFGSGSR